MSLSKLDIFKIVIAAVGLIGIGFGAHEAIFRAAGLDRVQEGTYMRNSEIEKSYVPRDMVEGGYIGLKMQAHAATNWQLRHSKDHPEGQKAYLSIYPRRCDLLDKKWVCTISAVSTVQAALELDGESLKIYDLDGQAFRATEVKSAGSRSELTKDSTFSQKLEAGVTTNFEFRSPEVKQPAKYLQELRFEGTLVQKSETGEETFSEEFRFGLKQLEPIDLAT